MRRQELYEVEALDIAFLAEHWPERAAELEIHIEAKGAAAAPDMPVAAGAMLVTVYVALIGALALTVGHGSHARFVILIDAFFVAMFFAIPVIFLRLEKDKSRRPTLPAFLNGGIETATGRINGSGALVQMLIVPLLLVIAILSIGIINLVT